jgi:hypothetical protein
MREVPPGTETAPGTKTTPGTSVNHWPMSCTQSGAVAHLMPPEHKKNCAVMHHHCRHRNKKLKKQQRLLQEIVVPHNILDNLLTNDDIENDFIVFDTRDMGNPPICPPRNVSVSPRLFVNVCSLYSILCFPIQLLTQSY